MNVFGFVGVLLLVALTVFTGFGLVLYHSMPSKHSLPTHWREGDSEEATGVEDGGKGERWKKPLRPNRFNSKQLMRVTGEHRN
jgi:hypothetical protein